MIPEFSNIDTLPQFDRFHSLSKKYIESIKYVKNLQDKNDESYKFANQVLKKVKNKNSFTLFFFMILKIRGEHNQKEPKRLRK